MGDLFSAYVLCSLLGASLLGASGAGNPLPGFMPFQENKVLWKVIGFAGLMIFQARWVVQWIHSERQKESKVPIAFWWLSLCGALLELAYFLRQQDSVGVCGYVVSAVPYTRNLMLVYRSRRLAAEAAARGVAATAAAEH